MANSLTISGADVGLRLPPAGTRLEHQAAARGQSGPTTPMPQHRG